MHTLSLTFSRAYISHNGTYYCTLRLQGELLAFVGAVPNAFHADGSYSVVIYRLAERWDKAHMQVSTLRRLGLQLAAD